MAPHRQRTRGTGDRPPNTSTTSDNNTSVNIPTQRNQYGLTANAHSDRPEQSRQVDSWRSYRNDTVNLQSSVYPQAGYQVRQPLGYTDPMAQNSSQPQGTNVHATAFTPYQPLRHSNGTSERQALQQAPSAPQANTTSRYSFRARRPDQLTPYSHGVTDTTIPPYDQGTHLPQYGSRNNRRGQVTSFSTLAANQPIPSIETTPTPLGLSSGMIPSSLPPRLGDRRSYSRTPENVAPPAPPKPTRNYLKMAAKAPELGSSVKKLLVILDLNGTLLVRPNGRSDPKKFRLRPGVTLLLDYLFKNHVVMVYSSARPENVTAITNNLIPPQQRAQLAAIWARDKLDLSQAQYFAKVQVYKKLDKIWGDKSIQASAQTGQRWDQTNTILVDDSRIKALAQPHNLVQVPEFENNAPSRGGEALRTWQLEQQEILKSLEQKLEELKMHVDVSRLIREWQAGTRQAPGVVDETIDQKTQQTMTGREPRLSPTPSVGQADESSEADPNPYQTPKSPSLPPGISQESQAAEGTHAALNSLENEINQALQNASLSDDESDKARQRSESPIGESVFTELLGGVNKSKEFTKNKRKQENETALDGPPTPKSMGT